MDKKRILRVVFCGGGTGGHTFPLIATARALKKLALKENFEVDLRYFGPDDFSLREFSKEGIRVQKIFSGKFNRFFDLRNFLSPFKILLGIFQSLWYLYWFMPDVCFSKGGFGALPVVFVSWLYRIPIICHESDSLPGLTTKITSKLAQKIAISFKKSQEFFKGKEVIFTGNPTRFEVSPLASLSKEALKKEAQKEFNLKEKELNLISHDKISLKMTEEFIELKNGNSLIKISNNSSPLPFSLTNFCTILGRLPSLATHVFGASIENATPFAFPAPFVLYLYL